MTAQAQATAILATLNTALPGAVTAYELDTVPTTRPADYVEVTVSRRFGGQLKQGGSLDVTGYRITVRAVSQVSVSNARNSLEKCRAALEFQRLAVGSGRTTPIQFETEDPTAPDDGWFSGLAVYTYAI